MTTKIALLGPRGTFSEEAALKFMPSSEKIFCSSINDVFEAVVSEKSDFGIVPVENSIEGSVAVTLELLLETDVTICTEIVLNINHCLLALPDIEIANIKEVISHPHALGQCRDFLKTLHGIRTKNFPSTAEAAKEVVIKNLKDTAAIAPRIAAGLYGLSVLEKNIQDQEKNETRFFVIALKCPNASDVEKTSIALGLKDKSGALYEVLGYFAKAGVNLTKIESRPTRKSLGDYTFYIDFLGSIEDEKINKILDAIKPLTTMLTILGSYSTDQVF